MPALADGDDEGDRVGALRRDRPFEAVAGLDDDVDPGLAANAEVPMGFEGEPLVTAELALVDVAEKEFAKKVRTLAAETDADRKSASRIMDIVSCLHIYFHVLAYSATAFQARIKSQPLYPAA